MAASGEVVVGMCYFPDGTAMNVWSEMRVNVGVRWISADRHRNQTLARRIDPSGSVVGRLNVAHVVVFVCDLSQRCQGLLAAAPWKCGRFSRNHATCGIKEGRQGVYYQPTGKSKKEIPV